MLSVLRDINNATDNPSAPARGIEGIEESESIAFENVAIATPEGHRLVTGLSFKAELGTNLLITGPNGNLTWGRHRVRSLCLHVLLEAIQ